MLFAWDEWNLDHVGRHDVTAAEAEHVVIHAEPPWPQETGEGKLLVWGPTEDGRLLQVIFVPKQPDEVEFDSLTIDEWAALRPDDDIAYVVHAMDLTPVMKRRYRRQRRRP